MYTVDPPAKWTNWSLEVTVGVSVLWTRCHSIAVAPDTTSAINYTTNCGSPSSTRIGRTYQVQCMNTFVQAVSASSRIHTWSNQFGRISQKIHAGIFAERWAQHHYRQQQQKHKSETHLYLYRPGTWAATSVQSLPTIFQLTWLIVILFILYDYVFCFYGRVGGGVQKRTNVQGSWSVHTDWAHM